MPEVETLLKLYKKPYNYLINANKSINNPKLYSSRLPPKLNTSDNNNFIVSKPKPKKK
jgi:hypothetical protein